MLNIPSESYGVLQAEVVDDVIGEVEEQVRRLGFGLLPSGFSSKEQENISNSFDEAASTYKTKYGERFLAERGEQHMVRAPLTFGSSNFVKVAANERLLSLLDRLIVGKYVLNQQNGVINPPQAKYSQGKWHRDLPYQHFVSNTPLAVNALYCVDDFSSANGSTFVVPASHREVKFPSEEFLNRNATQVEAKAGDFLVLDCMVFHSGGSNATSSARRGLNHVYTIPYFKQQISLPASMKQVPQDKKILDLLGYGNQEPKDIEAYLEGRTVQ